MLKLKSAGKKECMMVRYVCTLVLAFFLGVLPQLNAQEVQSSGSADQWGPKLTEARSMILN
ncbi:MAG: hypothetical protein U9N45_02375, partial [Gemmatimonadota bacterium]|nr:hypothetical protein [Gemmatimonadota bacterium]